MLTNNVPPTAIQRTEPEVLFEPKIPGLTKLFVQSAICNPASYEAFPVYVSAIVVSTDHRRFYVAYG